MFAVALATRCTSWARTLGAIAILGSGVVLASGCADEQESIIIEGAAAWPSSGECVVEASGTTFLSFGKLDASFGTPYWLPALVRNNIASSSADENNSGTDNSEVRLESVDVELSSAQAPDIIDALRARDSALVEFTAPVATDSLRGGETKGVIIEVITAAASQALADEIAVRYSEPVEITVVASVVLRASRTGNVSGGVGDIEARSYDFPIRVCLGCLIDCSSCEGGQCPASSTAYEGGVCGNAQDFYLRPSLCAQ